MAKRKFWVDLSCELEIDEAVISAVDDDWRKHFYKLDTPEEIAQHLAFNLLVNGARLTQLDGWADKHDDDVAIFRDTIDVVAVEVEPPKRLRRKR